MNKKTVLLASNLYRPNIGGIENSLYHLTLAYQDMGYKVIVFTSDISPSNDPLPSISEEGGARIYRYEVAKYSGLKRYLKHWTNGIKLLLQIRKTHAPELVISRYHSVCVMLQLAGYHDYLYLVPGVVKNQNNAANRSTSGKYALRFLKTIDLKINHSLQRRALARATRIGVFSKHMRKQIQELDHRFDNKIFECKPGVDVERFFPLAQSEKKSMRETIISTPENFVVLCVGRFVKAKGFEHVIRALQYTQGVELWLLGEGPDKQKYTELTRKLSLSSKVKLLNATTRPKELYRLADCFIMSSVYEPFGQTIIEALASGLPIVAFDSNIEGVETATGEFLTGQNVVWVERVEANAIAEKINHLQKSPSQMDEMCQKNRETAVLSFTWKSLAETLKDES